MKVSVLPIQVIKFIWHLKLTTDLFTYVKLNQCCHLQSKNSYSCDFQVINESKKWTSKSFFCGIRDEIHQHQNSAIVDIGESQPWVLGDLCIQVTNLPCRLVGLNQKNI
jgi:hypothetical protein